MYLVVILTQRAFNNNLLSTRTPPSRNNKETKKHVKQYIIADTKLQRIGVGKTWLELRKLIKLRLFSFYSSVF